MRSHLHSILISALASVLVVSAGCKKEEPAKKTEEAGGQTAASETAAKPSDEGVEAKKKAMARFRSEGLSARLGLEPITTEEVTPLIPSLTGATPIGQPASTGGGRRVTAIHCVEGSDVDKVKAELEKKLGEMGFTSVRSSLLGKQNILNISAEKAPFRLSATVRSGPFPDCPADQKKLKVLMSFFKRLQSPAGGTPPPPQPAPPAGELPK